MSDFVFRVPQPQFPKRHPIPDEMYFDDTLANLKGAILKVSAENPTFAAWLRRGPDAGQLEGEFGKALSEMKFGVDLDEQMWSLLQAITADDLGFPNPENDLAAKQGGSQPLYRFGYGMLKPLATSVTTLCELLGVEYRPTLIFTIDDLSKAYDGNTDAVCTVLSRIVNAEVTYLLDFGDPRLDDCYIWHYTDWRTADITYVARGSDHLHYDQSGKFYSPVIVCGGDPLLRLAGLDLKGNNVMVAWGEFWVDLRAGQKDARAYFHATSGRRPTHLLFTSDWGGANSVTRGVTADDLCSQMSAYDLKFFQKKMSKGKGEGLDYLAVPISITPELATRIEDYDIRRQLSLDRDDAVFAGRCELVKRIKIKRDGNQEELNDINHVLDELTGKCLESPALRFSGVEAPRIELFTIDMAEPSTDMSSAALLDLLDLQMKAVARGREYLAKVKAQVEAWLEFAPKFALLEDTVARLHGWIKIDGSGVKITLPDQESLAGEKPSRYIELEYVFSEDGLSACLDELARYQAMEEDLAKDNLDRLRDMGLIVDERSAQMPNGASSTESQPTQVSSAQVAKDDPEQHETNVYNFPPYTTAEIPGQ